MPNSKVYIASRPLSFTKQLLRTHSSKLRHFVLGKKRTSLKGRLLVSKMFSFMKQNSHHKLPTWTLSSNIFCLISCPVAGEPLRLKVELFDVELRFLRTTRFLLPFGPLSSISMKPLSVPILTKELKSVARPRI